MQLSHFNCTSHPNPLRSKFIELIKEGIIVTSHNLQPIYLSPKAQEICRRFCTNNNLDCLTSFLANIHNKLSENVSPEHREFVIDYQIDSEQIIRIRVNYLITDIKANISGVLSPNKQPWLLFFIEDRTAILQEELRIEQKKYGLSDRETEISGLLSQSYTYQDIAAKLQISLNTVKFHIKNINGKKRSYSATENYCFAV